MTESTGHEDDCSEDAARSQQFLDWAHDFGLIDLCVDDAGGFYWTPAIQTTVCEHDHTCNEPHQPLWLMRLRRAVRRSR